MNLRSEINSWDVNGDAAPQNDSDTTSFSVISTHPPSTLHLSLSLTALPEGGIDANDDGDINALDTTQVKLIIMNG